MYYQHIKVINNHYYRKKCFKIFNSFFFFPFQIWVQIAIFQKIECLIILAYYKEIYGLLKAK